MAAQIEMSRDLPWPRELVWQALTDPDALREWMMATDFKLQVGHTFRFVDRPAGGWRGWMDCEVLAFEAPSMLKISWRGRDEFTLQTVLFTLEATSESSTRLHLLHDNFDKTMGMGDGLILRWILGFGWKRMFGKWLPAVLTWMAEHEGQAIPDGLVDKPRPPADLLATTGLA